MATTKATELGQLGSKLTIHNEDITLDGNVHGQYAGFDSDFNGAIGGKSTSDLAEGTNLYYTNERADARVALVINSAPSTLDTLNELAAALGDDANFSTTVTNSIATKLPLAGGTMTGPLLFNAGVEAQFGGSNQMGLFSSSGTSHIRINSGTFKIRADDMRFTAQNGTTEYMRIDSSGNVGVGETSPTTLLHIKGDSAYASGATNLADATTKAVVRIRGSNDASTSIWVGGLANSIPYLQVANYNGSANDDLIFNPYGGNVGIGTTNSGAKLEVDDGGGTGQIRLTRLGSTRVELSTNANEGELSLYRSSNAKTVYISSYYDSYFNGGKVGIGTSSPTSLLSVGEVPTHNPGSAFTSSPSTFYSTTTLGGTTGNDQKIATFAGEDAANVSGLAVYRYRRSTGTNWLTDGFSLRQEVDNTENIFDYINFTGGKVGIGTTSPQEKLEVNGILQIRRDGDHPAIRFAEINSGTTTTRGYIASGDWAVNGGAIDDFGISGSATGDLLLATNAGAERLRIQNSTGNVGINNSNPSQRLTVNSPGGSGASAAGKYSEVMAQIHETGGQTESGRRGIMFFNDVNNWYNGTEKTVVGMAFNNNGAIRGGIQYDHKATERMTIWSGYGLIEFKVPSVTNQGDYRADQVDLTPLTIENLTGSVRINNERPSTAVNITEAQSIYSLSLKNRASGTRLSFSGDTTLSSTIQSMNPNNNGPAHIKLNPFGGKTVIGTYDEVAHNNDLTVDQGIYIQNAVPSTSQYVANAVIPNYAITFPVTAGITSQTTSNGSGWANIGWQPTARSGEVMHRNTANRYMVGGTGSSLGFYIEAGTSEAGGMCFDEDSTQVYGSSDNGTTFRIIDKDSDIVIMEMLQSSWNMSVRGAVNSSQSSFSGLSDRRVKKGFQDVSTENILTKYNNLDLKSYIRIDSYDYMKDNYENEEDLREIGLVAQEVEEIFPDVVGTTPVVDPRGMDSVWEELGEELTEIKNINQTGLLYKTIEAVQALIEENTELKARLDALEE